MQHEIDHLEGILFVDHLSRLKRAMALKQARQGPAAETSGLNAARMGLRLVFMGTPDFAVPTLAALIGHGHDIAAVYTQPARPKGRGLSPEPHTVATLAAAHGIDLRTPEILKDQPTSEAFAELAADAAVVVAYGLLLPKHVLDAPRLGCFNLHASLLPRWRGAAPIQRAIMAGDAETGVMAMRMEEGLDSGPGPDGGARGDRPQDLWRVA